jgi:pimeloyl-ACP methyl ester carboxylesterase
VPYTADTPPLILVPAGMAGVTDHRARFREIYCAVLDSHGRDLPDYRTCDQALTRVGKEPEPTMKPVELGPSKKHLIVGFVPGLGWECMSNWLNAAGTVAKNLGGYGYEMKLIEVSGLKGSDENARMIRDAILAMHLPAGDRRLVLVGYSKGAPDILEAVVRYPEIREFVAAVVSGAGSIGGSPLANVTEATKVDWLTHFPGAECEKGGGAALLSLRTGVRREWLAQNSLPHDFPYYSVVTFPEPGRISSVLKGSYDKLSKVDGRNDSQMIFYDQLIPGSALVAFVNADHWALAVPINRTHSTVGALFTTENAYPREALLEAVIRFVEEDLDARNEPRGP